MLRTWPVRLVAIALTLSVRSFQVPATPFTFAWPPSLPSVPTSRATRVTSEANEASCSTIVFTILPMRRNSPRSGRPSISTVMRLREVALGDRADDARDLGGRLDHVLDQFVDRRGLAFPSRRWRRVTRPRWVILPSLPTTLERRSNSWVISSFRDDDLVEQSGDLAVDAVGILGQARR